MRFFQGHNCFYACIGLLAFARGVTSSTSARLEKRVNDQTSTGSRRGDDRVTFDDLHSGYFQHQPYPAAPQGREVEEMFPNTYFYQRKPVFFTDTASSLSRNQLHEAYSLFGRAHVVDTEQGQYLTLTPPLGPSDNNMRRYMYDGGLDRFVRKVRVYERLFGRNAALVVFGPEMLRQETDRPDFRYRYTDHVLWREIRAAEAIPRTADVSSQQLREMLRRNRYVKVAGEDGHTALAMRFNVDGTFQDGLFGVLPDEAERELAALGHL